MPGDRSLTRFLLPVACPAHVLQLVAADGVLDRNFSLLGPGDTAVSGCWDRATPL